MKSSASRHAHHRATRLARHVTPELFRAAFPDSPSFIVAADSPDARRWNPRDRATFMGAEPRALFRLRRQRSLDGQLTSNHEVEWREPGRPSPVAERALGSPFAALRAFWQDVTSAPCAYSADYPFPFRAGLVGYVGYECGQLLERLPSEPRPSLEMPDMVFAAHRWVIASYGGASWLSVIGDGTSPEAAERDAIAMTERVARRLDASVGDPKPPPTVRRRELSQGIEPDAYLEKVRMAKQHIADGDAFEICLTNTLTWRCSKPLGRSGAWALYRELSKENPAPFAAFLDLPDGLIVSASPERFLSLSRDGVAESRPIKGTRPRSSDPVADAELAKDLRTAEKDLAENAMIVDLVRNDLGRVCRLGTVVTPHLFEVESYATVHQLVSTIRGELDRGRDGFDLLEATFPPGSMTGAPKIEAMTILEHLEPVERGVYSGALGWIDVSGAMDLSVVIRTIVIRGTSATFAVGGAVVADSIPEHELEETRHKGRALHAALEVVAPPAASKGLDEPRASS